MVDAERFRSILQRVNADLSDLRAYQSVDPEMLIGNSEMLRSVKYLFVTVIEGCIDAAQHVCSSEGWGPPANNGDAMLVLGHNGLLEGSQAQTMAAVVGFRNILVHRYADIDDRRVSDALSRLGDLDDFVAALARLVR